MKTNFIHSDLFNDLFTVLGIVLSLVLSVVCGYWLAVASGANISTSNPLADAVLFSYFFFFLVVFLVGFIFVLDKFLDWQLDQRMNNLK